LQCTGSRSVTACVLHEGRALLHASHHAGSCLPIRSSRSKPAALVYGLLVDERPSYWEQQYRHARPSGVLLWSATHRRLVRAIFGFMIALSIGLLIWAVLEDGSLVSPTLNIFVFVTQFILWGFLFPRQVDEWRTRQAADADPDRP
jgi:hypothetical protein